MPIYNEQMSIADIGPEYAAFVEKFAPKKTTDDCYTPENVYNAVADWACEEYGVSKATLVRPFWPGADYEHVDYPEGCVVMDNPPFSILSRIVQFYLEHAIRFFLFAPALTCLNQCIRAGVCTVAVGVNVVYENGAEVSTSFVTNLEPALVLRSAPALYQRVEEANRQNLRMIKKQLPKYQYPDHVITGGICQKYSKYGIDFRATANSAMFINSLEAQKACGKKIFGGGLLLSDRAAAERAAAERAAAERAAAERWELSERELTLVRMMSKEHT